MHAPPSEEITDEGQLIRTIQNGSLTESQAAFATLYHSYQLDVWRFIQSKVQNESTADELTGRVWSLVVEKIYSYQWQGKPVKSWLFGIAHRLLLEQWREPQWVSLESLGYELVEEPSALANQQREQILHQAIQQLPPLQQKIVLYYLYTDWNWKQIAEQLTAEGVEISHDNVRTIFGRIKTKLREWPPLRHLFE
jgi:RNA polymerase sigma factor (sigma-70 family)